MHVTLHNDLRRNQQGDEDLLRKLHRQEDAGLELPPATLALWRYEAWIIQFPIASPKVCGG